MFSYGNVSNRWWMSRRGREGFEDVVNIWCTNKSTCDLYSSRDNPHLNTSLSHIQLNNFSLARHKKIIKNAIKNSAMSCAAAYAFCHFGAHGKCLISTRKIIECARADDDDIHWKFWGNYRNERKNLEWGKSWLRRNENTFENSNPIALMQSNFSPWR